MHSNSPVPLSASPVLSVDGYTPAEVRRSVELGQAGAISDMTASGLLSNAGPITEADVGTLVFMAISANDLLEQLSP